MRNAACVCCIRCVVGSPKKPRPEKATNTVANRVDNRDRAPTQFAFDHAVVKRPENGDGELAEYVSDGDEAD